MIGSSLDSNGVDGAEGEVDAGGLDFFGFWEGVEPVRLGFVEHEQEVAMLEEDGGTQGGVFFVFEVEAAGGAEAEGGDGGVSQQHGFVIAVPGHAFGAGVVEVGQAGVVGGAGGGFDAGFYGGQGGCPGLSAARDAGVGVGERAVAMPGDLAGGDDALAEEADFVVLPGEFGQQGGEGGGGFGFGQQGAVVDDGAILGQQVLFQGSRNTWSVRQRVRGEGVFTG